MLGKRRPQQSYFDAIGLPHRVSPDSFYGRMGSLTGKLLRDDDLKEMYTSNNPVNATDITGNNEMGMLLQSKVFS
jgi:hypothetical protein